MYLQQVHVLQLPSPPSFAFPPTSSVLRPSRYGFVNFTAPDEAQQAIQTTNNMQFGPCTLTATGRIFSAVSVSVLVLGVLGVTEGGGKKARFSSLDTRLHRFEALT